MDMRVSKLTKVLQRVSGSSLLRTFSINVYDEGGAKCNENNQPFLIVTCS
jgi:hypothetical protein